MLGHNGAPPPRRPPVTAHTCSPAKQNSRTSLRQRTGRREGPGDTRSHPTREPRRRYVGSINQMRPWQCPQEYRPQTPLWPGPPLSHPLPPCAHRGNAPSGAARGVLRHPHHGTKRPDITGSISIYVPPTHAHRRRRPEGRRLRPRSRLGMDRTLVEDADQNPGGSRDSSKASPNPPQNRGTVKRHDPIAGVVALTALGALGTITAADTGPKDPGACLAAWSSM